MSAPRTGFVGTLLESARQTLLRLRHHRLWWVVAVGAVLLGVAAWLLGMRAQERHDARSLFCIVAWWLQGVVLMPWAAIYIAVSTVHGSLEDRTFQYLFLRPVNKVALLLGNWLAVAAVAAFTAAVGTTAIFAGLAAHGEAWSAGVDIRVWLVFVRTFAVGAIAYAAAGVCFSAWLRRPLFWAALFVVGLQQMTANLRVSAGLRQLTITDPLRRLILDGVEPDARLADQLWPAEDFRPELIGSRYEDLGWFCVVVMAIAAWAYQRTEYDSRQRE